MDFLKLALYSYLALVVLVFYMGEKKKLNGWLIFLYTIVLIQPLGFIFTAASAPRKRCEHCHKNIFLIAETCPHCGKDVEIPFYEKKLAYILVPFGGILTLMFLIGSIAAR